MYIRLSLPTPLLLFSFLTNVSVPRGYEAQENTSRPPHINRQIIKMNRVQFGVFLFLFYILFFMFFHWTAPHRRKMPSTPRTKKERQPETTEEENMLLRI